MVVSNYFRVGLGSDAPVFFFDDTDRTSMDAAWSAARGAGGVDTNDALAEQRAGTTRPRRSPRISIYRSVRGEGPWRYAFVIGVAPEWQPATDEVA